MEEWKRGLDTLVNYLDVLKIKIDETEIDISIIYIIYMIRKREHDNV